MGRDPDPDRPRVVAGWEGTFGTPPPKYLSVAFMEKAVRFEAQCKASGGLPAAARRALARIAAGEAVVDASPTDARAGSHLVREWNGRTYQVEVLKRGFRMDGREWGSLSAIARHITGATWSGPRFFGLSGRAGRRP